MKANRIAHLYADPGPFASVFVDVSQDSENGAHEAQLRVREVADRLRDSGAPGPVIDAVAERLGLPGDVPSPASQVVVATERGVLLDDLVHTNTTHATATWDALPDIGGWIASEDGAIAFALALVDHEGGEILTYGPNGDEPRSDERVGGQDPHEHKMRGGGLSHRRYQRTAENVWADNAEAVAEGLRSSISDGIRLVILAGDPASRTAVCDALGSAPSVEVVELEHGGRAADGGDAALHDAVDGVLTDHTTAQRLGVVHDLKERLGRGEGAETGVRDVADAFVRGQVASLLIDPDELAGYDLDPRDHPGLPLTDETATGQPVRSDRGLIAAAARTGADVVVSPAGAMSGTPVAALLRWDGTR